jgi:predicted ArsR family transcriptional regulator
LQTGTPGKPAIVYEATPGSEDSTSRAYRIFLAGLLTTLRIQLDDAQLSRALAETGRLLARSRDLPDSTDFKTRLAQAMAAVDALGASTETVRDGDAIIVRNYSCPVASAVRTTPCVCKAVAAFFEEATGRPVTECCRREDRLICQYRIDAPFDTLDKSMPND